MPTSNNGPFRIFTTDGKEFRMFVCEDGIVIVRPGFWRHFPGQLISGLIGAVIGLAIGGWLGGVIGAAIVGAIGGAIGGGIGGAIEGAMSANEYQRVDRRAKDVGFVSSEKLAASIPRSTRYLADQVGAVTLKKGKLTFIMQSRQLKNLGRHEFHWLLGKDDFPAQTALKQLFEDRFRDIAAAA